MKHHGGEYKDAAERNEEAGSCVVAIEGFCEARFPMVRETGDEDESAQHVMAAGDRRCRRRKHVVQQVDRAKRCDDRKEEMEGGQQTLLWR